MLTEIQWRRFCSFRDSLLKEEQPLEGHNNESATHASSKGSDEDDAPLRRRRGSLSSDMRRDRVQTRSPLKRKATSWQNPGRCSSPSRNKHSSCHPDSAEPVIRRRHGTSNHHQPAEQWSSCPWNAASAASGSTSRLKSVIERSEPEKLPPWRDQWSPCSHQDVNRRHKRLGSQPHPGEHQEPKNTTSARANPGKHEEPKKRSVSQAHPGKQQESQKKSSSQAHPGQHQESRRTLIKRGFLKRTLAKRISSTKESTTARNRPHRHNHIASRNRRR